MLHLMLFTPWQSSSSCVNGDIVVLEKCIFFGSNIWVTRRTWLPKPVHVLPCNNSAMKGNNWTTMDTRVLLPKPSQNLPRVEFYWWSQAFRIGCSPNVNSSCCKERQTIWPCQAFPVVCCRGFVVVTPSFTHLSITFSNQRFATASVV
jgi:hypothetical protein